MKETEIQKLAEEIVNPMYGNADLDDSDTRCRYNEDIIDARVVIRALLDNYHIIPKETINAIYAEADTQPHGHLSSEDFINLGMRTAINKIFGNEKV